MARDRKIAKAPVAPIRQRTQYSCMAASMCMCLRAHGLACDEDQVNEVMGARPMKGASWEDALACGQHYGMRCTLVSPATVIQLKEWTDRQVPVMIAWNPENRPWSHASVVFDVDDDGSVYVADPNIPNPDETVRVLPKEEFYGKWYEKFPNYLFRRPAMAVEREITEDGRQVLATALDAPASRGLDQAYDEYVQAVINLEASADQVVVASNRLRFLGFEPDDEYYPFRESIHTVATDIYRWRGEVERRCTPADLPQIAHRIARLYSRGS